MCVWGGGGEKWPFPSLGGRGSPLPKWAESLRCRNLNEEPEPTLTPSLLPPHPISSPSFTGLLSHDAADYSIDLFKGLHFMIMNFTVLRQYVSWTATQLHHRRLLRLLLCVLQAPPIRPSMDYLVGTWDRSSGAVKKRVSVFVFVVFIITHR